MKENRTNYQTPEVEFCTIVNEGIICSTGDGAESGNEEMEENM